MREIIFKAKKSNGECWIYGSLIQYSGTHSIYVNDDSCQYDVVSETIGQFTGLKDKNGVDIYEGDIVKTGYPVNGWIYYSAPSFGVENKKGVCTEFDWEDFEKFEIIGNIHQNPELL